ncbi:MAG: biopolymer transporter ExbD [Planctomycetota bacterium]|jgi:biopolymer transport protein ExbD|nr:biopolymer transporter ExbD [Planctomycetia bacterium]
MKLHKSRRVALTVPLASMGDIAFLLTIFFLLTSNFAKDDTRNITPPTATQLAELEKQNISVSIDADGGIFFNGRPVGSPGVIEAGVAGFLVGKKEPQDRMVVFRCDKAVDQNVFEPVLAAISKAGGVIAAVGEKSKP